MILNSCVMAPTGPVIDVINDKGQIVAQYTGSDISIPDVASIANKTNNKFYIWVKSSCGVRFTYVPRNTAIDICCVGHGAPGGDPSFTRDEVNGCDISTGGAGGKGGQVVTKSNINIWSSFWVDCVVEDTTYVRYGTEAWGAATGGGSNGGTGGQYIKYDDTPEDNSDPDNPIPAMPGAVSITSPTRGSQGSLSFGDTVYDPLYYGPGGGGANAAPESGYAAPGDTQNAPGTGGHGRSSMSEPIDEGKKGVILIRTHVVA